MVFCLIRFWSEIVEVLQERDIVQYSNACVHMSNWYGEKNMLLKFNLLSVMTRCTVCNCTFIPTIKSVQLILSCSQDLFTKNPGSVL